MYIDDLPVAISLNKEPVLSGCFVGDKCLNHIAFADDICCFAPSLCGLQDLLNVSNNFAIGVEATADLFHFIKNTIALILKTFIV